MYPQYVLSLEYDTTVVLQLLVFKKLDRGVTIKADKKFYFQIQPNVVIRINCAFLVSFNFYKYCNGEWGMIKNKILKEI